MLKKLVSDPETRLGRNGAEEIKKHPFFEGLDWDGLRKQRSPYIPSVTSEISTENFDKFEEEEPFFSTMDNRKKAPLANRRVDMNFIGYTYKADVENEKCMLVNVLKELDSIQSEQKQEQVPPPQSIKPPSTPTGASSYQQQSQFVERPSSSQPISQPVAKKVVAPHHLQSLEEPQPPPVMLKPRESSASSRNVPNGLTSNTAASLKTVSSKLAQNNLVNVPSQGTL